jgi:hypothetical protein
MAEAFRMQEAARDASTDLDDPLALGDALCYLGEIHTEWGQFEASFQECRHALEL